VMLILGRGHGPTAVQHGAAMALASFSETLEDLRAAGPLLEARRFWMGRAFDGQPARSATAALTHLLAHLQPEHAATLTVRQRQALYDVIDEAALRRRGRIWAGSDHPLPHFYAAAITALAALRNARVTPALKELATMRADTPSRDAVRHAAQETLLAILLRRRR
jgi:hypothetical protein